MTGWDALGWALATMVVGLGLVGLVGGAMFLVMAWKAGRDMRRDKAEVEAMRRRVPPAESVAKPGPAILPLLHGTGRGEP